MKTLSGMTSDYLKDGLYRKMFYDSGAALSLLSKFNVLKSKKSIFYIDHTKGDFYMNNKLKDDSVDFLFQAILSLENLEECYDFFEDLCTVAEIKAMSQRIIVAKMLNEKRVYNDIVNETGASTATISRVNRSLNYGCDGYEKIFKRINPQ